MRNIVKQLVPLLLVVLILTGCTGLTDHDSAGSSSTLHTIRPPSDAASSSFPITSPGEATSNAQTCPPALEPDNTTFDPCEVPAYSGNAYVLVNDNRPYFQTEELSSEGFESYSDLDVLGRCGVAYANVCLDTMPTEERGAIGMIKPTGWHTIRYDDLIDGKYLYNRCHLIGYQLSAENANVKNLITGTRYLNVQGMLPFENMVADYVKETEHHVAYRSTPVFEGDELLARGVLLEGWSVEDQGEGICFCVFAYNVQPGIEIDYATGNSRLATEAPEPGQTPGDDPPVSNPAVPDNPQIEPNTITYIANTNTKKFHYPDCSSVTDIKESNKLEYTGTAEELIEQGYSPCQRCKPS